MKLKRFVAKDMREALTMVKDELGADAIIMSNKRVPAGIEIVAGVESLPLPLSRPAPASVPAAAAAAAATPAPNTTNAPAAQQVATPAPLNNHQIGSALANLANAVAMNGQQRQMSDDVVQVSTPSLGMGGGGASGQQQLGLSGANNGGESNLAPNAGGSSTGGKNQAYAQSLIEILERQNAMSKQQGDALLDNIAAHQQEKAAQAQAQAQAAAQAQAQAAAQAAAQAQAQAAAQMPTAAPPALNLQGPSAGLGTLSAPQGISPAADLRATLQATAAQAQDLFLSPQAAAAQVRHGMQAKGAAFNNQAANNQTAATATVSTNNASPDTNSAQTQASTQTPRSFADEAAAALGMQRIADDSLKGTGVSRIINPIDDEGANADDMADPTKKAGPSRIDPSLDEDADLFKTPPLPLSQQRDFKNFFGKSKVKQAKEEYESKAGIDTYRASGADASLVRQDFEKMRAEVENIRKLLQFELAGLLQDNRSRTDPVKAMIAKLLQTVGFSERVCDLLLSKLPAEISFNGAWKELVNILERSILVGDDEIISKGGIVTLIGPAGVGKTTTLAKLAARFVMRYGPQRVAIVTADHYRIGAVEQIKTYGRIMGCATFAVKNLSELPQLLYSLSDKSLILVDTAGVGFKDERFNTQLQQLKLQASLKLKHYLVLPCTTQRKVLQHAYDHFAVVGLTGLIITKIDECQNLGDALSLCIEMKTPISYITDGQRVPEDLDVPNTNMLARRALAAVDDETVQRAVASKS
ncbi:MAG: flagellar biosynthesis protein FlhF [Candidatus Anaerobiospirillum pullicola]|uniref:Flagellar biosynthesis protein FlhF n=1 Tax=Candidatus Anaerobiospirillum pullicola TaxID=2838451 RepID=A0A948THJ3_9GAMM|nr:flagellar biosynthesis protein FlhF [Candidatus Anaerobiospirillum pullicola]